MGVSIRAYARHRGVSDTTVRKAIERHRITLEPDGTLDIDKADTDWARNTHPLSGGGAKKAVSQAALDAVKDTLQDPSSNPSGDTTYLQARTANEVLKAQTQKLKLQALKKELVDRSQALAHVFRLARQERDAWQSWPARISAQMAVDLEVDAHTLHVMLERYVREHLSELADLQPRVD